MRDILIIARKEINTALRSVSYYTIFFIFLLISGFFFSNTIFKFGLADMRVSFGILHVLFLFYIPAITMNSIAGETSTGTFELLATMPIRLSSIIWGKFVAALAMLKSVILCTLVYVVIVAVLGRGLDAGAVVTGYLGLILAGCAYIAIGIFASSLPSNQILAFIIAVLISGFFFGIRYLIGMLPMGVMQIFQYLSFDYHLQNAFKGVIDLRDILFFGVISLVFMLLAEFILRTRNLMQER
ncbi:MAG TPA: ABC transporter permease subunit [Candidatus Cloacimonadota bacterium]|nr:ABC transporter permease subunit [Candidatus Cloacimonadota bacterium]